MNPNKHLNTDYARLIIAGLQQKPMYEGTVPESVKAQRRAKGKLAKAARRRQRA